MGINLNAFISAEKLNDIESKIGTFESNFLSIAYDHCLPFMPDEFFNDPLNKEDLKSFLLNFFGENYS